MENILYINACVREESRTNRLAKHLLSQLGDYTEVSLKDESLQPLHNENLEERVTLVKNREFSDPSFRYVKQFVEADTIVIAAPYWDFSFPSVLKLYLEHIFVAGIAFRYEADGSLTGLCKAKKLYYVTTAGGPYNGQYSYEYVRNVAHTFFGIKETELIKAEMLDIVGADVEGILQKAMDEIHVQ